MKNGILSKSEARILAEALGNHLIEENARCIHFPHPSHMVKVELLPLPTRGKSNLIIQSPSTSKGASKHSDLIK